MLSQANKKGVGALLVAPAPFISTNFRADFLRSDVPVTLMIPVSPPMMPTPDNVQWVCGVMHTECDT